MGKRTEKQAFRIYTEDRATQFARPHDRFTNRFRTAIYGPDPGAMYSAAPFVEITGAVADDGTGYIELNFEGHPEWYQSFRLERGQPARVLVAPAPPEPGRPGTIQHTAETCPGRPCSSDCDHVQNSPLDVE